MAENQSPYARARIALAKSMIQTARVELLRLNYPDPIPEVVETQMREKFDFLIASVEGLARRIAEAESNSELLRIESELLTVSELPDIWRAAADLEQFEPGYGTRRR